MIAPAAENHSTPRRCISLLLLTGLIPVVLFSTIDKETVALLAFVIVTPALIIALTETTRLLPVQHLRIIKNNFIRRIVGTCLQPGLAAGIVFSIVLVIVVLGIALLPPQTATDGDFLTILLACLGTLLLPAVVQSYTFKTDAQRIANYLLLLVGSGVLSIIIGTLSAAMSSREFMWLFIWNPLTFLTMIDRSEFSDSSLFIGALAVVIVFSILLLLKSLQLMKAQREILSYSKSDP
jgi:hypothetical protein